MVRGQKGKERMGFGPSDKRPKWFMDNMKSGLDSGQSDKTGPYGGLWGPGAPGVTNGAPKRKRERERERGGREGEKERKKK